MTKQYIWALAIAGAFVAGTILTSTLYDNTAFAIHQPNHNPPGDDNDMGWKEAVADLQDQIDSFDINDADNDPENELQNLNETFAGLSRQTLDLDDADDVVSFDCSFLNSYIQELQIESCPGGDICGSGDDLQFTVQCQKLSLTTNAP